MCITAEFIYWLEFVVETSCLILIIDRALPADYSHLPSYAKTPDLYIEHLTSLHAQLSKVHVILLVVIGFVVNKYQSCTIPCGLPDLLTIVSDLFIYEGVSLQKLTSMVVYSCTALDHWSAVKPRAMTRAFNCVMLSSIPSSSSPSASSGRHWPASASCLTKL